MKLSDIYWEDKIIFPKYPEPWIDFNFWDKYEFRAWNYPEKTILTEAARYLPVVWNMESIIWKKVLSPEMLDYYSYYFALNKEKIKDYENKNYNQIIDNLPQKTLITPQTFQNFNPEVYAINPNISYFLNSKENIWELTKNIAKREILNKEKIKNIKIFPFVLKSNSWASWDWVRIIKSEKDLKNALSCFTEKKLIVEEFIKEKANFWVQIFIPKNWEIEILSLTNQITSENGEYEWSYINKNLKIDEKLKEICIEIWENAKKKWFYWVAWLDFLQKENWDFIFIDPNFRITWATNLVLLKNKIFEETWKNFILWWQFKFNWENMNDFLDKSIQNNILIMSAFCDKIDKIINWFCIYSWNNLQEINKNKQKLKKLWFNI